MKLIGISGISGSGKTHLLAQIKSELREAVSVLSFDNYYKPIDQQQKDENGFENFDLPSGVDIDRFLDDLEALRRGESVRIKVYNFNNPAAEEVFMDIHPAPVLLVEGLYVFHFGALFDQLDYRVYVHASHSNSLSRRLRRDLAERGLSEETNLYQWHHHAVPGFEQYVTVHQEKADLVLNNDEDTSDAFRQLKAAIEKIRA